jgi:hypothetical protein
MGLFSHMRGARRTPASRPDRYSACTEYYRSERDLYRIEHVRDGRAVIEDCRTGALIDVPVSYLRRLHPVSRQPSEDQPDERLQKAVASI